MQSENIFINLTKKIQFSSSIINLFQVKWSLKYLCSHYYADTSNLFPAKKKLVILLVKVSLYVNF